MAPAHEFSAGGVLVRRAAQLFELAVIQPRGRPLVAALPKGHFEPGETAEQAAAREVLEETGLTGCVEQPLGEVKYGYRFRGRPVLKTVRFFLLRYQSGQIDLLTEQMRVEVDRAYWVPLDQAAQTLSYPGERQMAARALALVRETLAP